MTGKPSTDKKAQGEMYENVKEEKAMILLIVASLITWYALPSIHQSSACTPPGTRYAAEYSKFKSTLVLFSMMLKP